MDNNNEIDDSKKVIIENKEMKTGMLIIAAISVFLLTISILELYFMSPIWWMKLIMAVILGIWFGVEYVYGFSSWRIEAYNNKLYIEKSYNKKYIIDYSQILNIKRTWIEGRRGGGYYQMSIIYKENEELFELKFQYNDYSEIDTFLKNALLDKYISYE